MKEKKFDDVKKLTDRFTSQIDNTSSTKESEILHIILPNHINVFLLYGWKFKMVK